jgi:hypothetical protein
MIRALTSGRLTVGLQPQCFLHPYSHNKQPATITTLMPSTSGSDRDNPTFTRPLEEVKAHLETAMQSQDAPQQKETALDKGSEGKGEGSSSSVGKQESKDTGKTEGAARARGSKKRYM